MLATRFSRLIRTTPVPRSTSIIKVATIATMSEDLDKASLTKLYRAGILKAPTDTDIPDANQKYNDIIHIWKKGDITKLQVDAIVNAANHWLFGGGGVDGAIHAAAGPSLKEECKGLNGCDTGDAKITTGHKLPAKHVIHAVGPVYTKNMGDKNAELLASCYRKSLQLAVDNGLKSIAFPCISTGVYDYPSDDASIVALDTVSEFLAGKDMDKKFEVIVFCVFLDKDAKVYMKNAP